MLFSMLIFPLSVVFFALAGENSARHSAATALLGAFFGFAYSVAVRIMAVPSLAEFSFSAAFSRDFVFLAALPFGICFFCDFLVAKFRLSDFFGRTSVFCAGFFSAFSPCLASLFSGDESVFTVVVRPFLYFCVLLSVHFFISVSAKSLEESGRPSVLAAFLLACQICILPFLNAIHSLKFPLPILSLAFCAFFACLALQIFCAGIFAAFRARRFRNKNPNF